VIASARTLNTEDMRTRTYVGAITWLICSNAGAQAQISGTITGDDGLGVPFASVIVGDYGFGTRANEQGVFELKGVGPGQQHLRVACVGYTTLDTSINVIADNTPLALRLRTDARQLREVQVSALRAGDRSPFAQNTVTREQLHRINTGVDMPLLLDQLPSVVTTTDAGTGFGYTGIRIRGSDATRINVTINGVPLNDAESQAVYWVNLPDLVTSTEDIEVQRGVGSSTNGPGAFGGSINIRTTAVKKAPNASVSIFGGSYGTQRYTASLGTGLIKDRFSFDGRISSISSDGYIDRASAKLKSYFLQGAWIGRTSSLRFITFSGHEVTYQAWNGVPKEVLDTNRTWNEFTYANQVDDYTQTHYQVLFDHQLGKRTDLNITLFRVDGSGFYEEYRSSEMITSYGITPPPQDSGTGELARTDVIRRRWLDNTLNGMNLAIRRKQGRTELTLSGSAMRYDGRHFGQVLWAGSYTVPLPPFEYYADDARKDEANVFIKGQHRVNEKLELFAEAQVRGVRYDYDGFNQQLTLERQRASLTFFNPKVGAQWRPGQGQRAYASFAVGNKEPGRDDFVNAAPGKRPKAETLFDTEVGWERRTARTMISIGLYNMVYEDQLVSTGQLNDVGLYTRTNVPNSYRQGAELQARAMITSRFTLGGNATFSRNKIRDFTDFADDYDNGGQRATALGETDIAFSPNVIAGGEATWRLWNNVAHGHADLTWIAKCVGSQFLDNTSSDERSLDAYYVNDLRANVSLTGVKGTKSIDLNLTVRNIFSELYESNGWSYSYWYGGERVSGVGYYPQAPMNLLAGITMRF
jgi:iron complex outermembrane receptor protein